MENDSRYGASLLAACFLLFVFTLFFFPVLFEGNTFFFSDIQHFAYPMKLYLARVWAAGEWPYWYPYLFQGRPFTVLGEINSSGPLCIGDRPAGRVFFITGLNLQPFSINCMASFNHIDVAKVLAQRWAEIFLWCRGFSDISDIRR